MKATMDTLVGFATFYDAVKSQKIPTKTAYNLAKLNRAIAAEVDFFREKAQACLMECAELDSDDNPIYLDNGSVKIQADKVDEFMTAMNELEAFEVELPDIAFEIDDFADIEIPTEALCAALPFFKD